MHACMCGTLCVCFRLSNKSVLENFRLGTKAEWLVKNSCCMMSRKKEERERERGKQGPVWRMCKTRIVSNGNHRQVPNRYHFHFFPSTINTITLRAHRFGLSLQWIIFRQKTCTVYTNLNSWFRSDALENTHNSLKQIGFGLGSECLPGLVRIWFDGFVSIKICSVFPVCFEWQPPLVFEIVFHEKIKILFANRFDVQIMILVYFKWFTRILLNNHNFSINFKPQCFTSFTSLDSFSD